MKKKKKEEGKSYKRYCKKKKKIIIVDWKKKFYMNDKFFLKKSIWRGYMFMIYEYEVDYVFYIYRNK